MHTCSFPWAKQHMRIAFIGYRDFMYSGRTVEKEPFVWDGGPASPPSLGAPEAAAGSADRLKVFLKGVRASGGADMAEDVLGGLLKVRAWGYLVVCLAVPGLGAQFAQSSLFCKLGCRCVLW